ncbi:MAG: transposase family protein, partial [Ornithinimicrobium sp.]
MGLEGFHVVQVVQQARHLRVVVESDPAPAGCHTCGVVAASHGRREVRLVDVPTFGRPVRLVWRKRTWRCAE